LNLSSRRMVLVDFHKHAKKQAPEPQSGSVSTADMFLAISVRRTTPSIAFIRPAGDDKEASKVGSHILLAARATNARSEPIIQNYCQAAKVRFREVSLNSGPYKTSALLC
jgi:hypothetical protein